MTTATHTAAAIPTPGTTIPTVEEATAHLTALKGAYRAALEAGDPTKAWRVRQERGQAEEVVRVAHIQRQQAVVAELEQEAEVVAAAAQEALTIAERARDAALKSGGLPDDRKASHHATMESANAGMAVTAAQARVQAARRDLAAVIERVAREGWAK